MEAAHLMGVMEMYKPGEWAICDKCEKPQPLAGGYSVIVDYQAVIWLCEGCKAK